MGATGLQFACVAAASFVCASVASAADVESANVGSATADTTQAQPSAGATPNPPATAPQGYAAIGLSTPPKNFFTYGADTGIGYSDNITESSNDKRGDEMLGIGVQLAGLEQSARFQGGVLADLEHVNYLQGTFSPQLIGNFAGYGSYALIPDYIHWMAQDSFGQGLIDPFASQSPGNLENINTLTTGPTFSIPLSALTMLNVSARYSRVSYQVSPLDSNDYGGSVSLAHLLSARSRISVNIQDERYEYTDPINPSYQDREVYVRYDIQGARTHIDADVGYDQVRGSDLSSNGVLARLSISRTIAEGSVVSLSAGRDTSNSSSFLTQSQSVTGIGLQTTSGRQTATPFTNQYESLSWGLVRRRTTFSFGVAHYLQLYDGQSSLDNTITSGSARVSRVVYPGWSVGLAGEYSKNIFSPLSGGNYTQKQGGLNVKWQMARKLALSFEYDHFIRNSEAQFNYTENRVWVRIQYGSSTPGGPMGGSSSDAAALGVARPDPFNIPSPTH